MKTKIYFLAAFSILSLSALTGCSNNDGTDSFRESLDLPEKKDNTMDGNQKADSTDYEKNYPGDSI